MTQAVNIQSEQFRVERDPLGEVRLPLDALYGAQTARALDNFQISRLRFHPLLIAAFAEIKKAAAETHLETGSLDPQIGAAIIAAADEIMAGEWREQFSLDVFQAGAGTSLNMNVNEVIANRALEIIGAQRGDQSRIHPNDHVNKSQSTNDTMPTAMRTTTLRLLRPLIQTLDQLAASMQAKAAEFADVVKSGRTHLHDATPITLGQEFSGYGDNIARATERLRACEMPLPEVPLGGTAVGTGVNTHPDYARLVVAKLGQITGLPLREARNRFQSMQSLGDFAALSGALRGLAIELSKIANDLRLPARVVLVEARAQRPHERHVQTVQPDHRLGLAVVAMVVPGPVGRQDQVAGVHGHLLALHHGEAARALDDEAQRGKGVAVGRRDLAGQDHLQ